MRALLQSARRDLAAAARRVGQLAAAVGPRSNRLARTETERTLARERRLRSVDPRSVLDRGYSILRLDGGPTLSDAAAAPAGTAVCAQLRRGSLRLRSEGAVSDEEATRRDG